jgi:hypothetical protein
MIGKAFRRTTTWPNGGLSRNLSACIEENREEAQSG